MFAPVSVRLRKIPNGTSGADERSSVTTKIANRISEPPIRLRILVEPQPEFEASTNA